MKDRIREIMESQHMSQQVFAQFIEMAPATLSSIFNGRTRPTLNIVEAIKKKIPAINTDWLMFGQGPMYIDQVAPQEPSLDFGDSVLQATQVPVASSQDLYSPTPSPSHHPRQEMVREEIRLVEKPQRKITEIRIYFDDLTFETFVPDRSK